MPNVFDYKNNFVISFVFNVTGIFNIFIQQGQYAYVTYSPYTICSMATGLMFVKYTELSRLPAISVRLYYTKCTSVAFKMRVHFNTRIF